MEDQFSAGTLFEIQVIPKFVEVKIEFEKVVLPLAASAVATNFLPSADDATEVQAKTGEPLLIQLIPEFVETQSGP